MGRFVAGLFVAICCFGTAALATQGKTAKEVTVLVKEIEGKVISRSNTSISVKAAGCSLSIEFRPQCVVFDLPLAGAKVVESGLDSCLIIINSRMIRTVPSRTPETFERLTLRFGKHDLLPMKTAFEQAIQACGS